MKSPKIIILYKEPTMSNIDKLYTVDDIAKMTLLTTRTIRNYLKDGLLTGRKVGGQWRFTKEDIDRLFENSSIEKEMLDSRKQDIMDFIDGVNTDMEGDIQTCTIVDYYCNNKEHVLLLSNHISSLIPDITGYNRFYYEYIDTQEKARYTLFGIPTFIRKAMNIIEEEWNKLNVSHNAFDDKANNYDDYRPSYPNEVRDLILTLIKKENINIADIGAGTGKLSRLLLTPRTTLFAIEPNEDMIAIAKSKHSISTNYKILKGTAELTGLETDSIDVITVAQAYHWFDNDNTKLEFKRILKKDGYVVLLWNRFDGNPYDNELNETRRFCKETSVKKNNIPNEDRAKHLFGENNYIKSEFDNTIFQSLDAFIGGSLSASFAPKKGEVNYDAYINALKVIFNKYCKDNVMKSKITTECFYGKI